MRSAANLTVKILGDGDMREDSSSANRPVQLPEETAAPETLRTAGEATLEPSSSFEDLTLAALLADFLRQPGRTWRQFIRALRRPAQVHGTVTIADGPERALPATVKGSAEPRASASKSPALPRWRPAQRQYVRLLLYGLAIISAIIGSRIVRGSAEISRANDYSLHLGAPYLWLGFLLWLGAEAVGGWSQIKTRWRQSDAVARARYIARLLPAAIGISATHLLAQSLAAPGETALPLAGAAISRLFGGLLLWFIIEVIHGSLRKRAPFAGDEPKEDQSTQSARRWIVARQPLKKPVRRSFSRLRATIIGLACVGSVVVWFGSSGNRIEPPVILVWAASITLWSFAFAPLGWHVFDWASRRIDAIRRVNWREQRWTLLGFALVLILGASFRLDRLTTVPPEMFADLVEIIQDAYQIYHAEDYRIFFDNNGGREPLHFYLLGSLAKLPGMGYDHYALKLMTAIEGLLTLPLMYWLGLEVMRGRKREFRLAYGLIAAGLVAVSFWHSMMSRQGMRIPLAPLFTALTAVFYVRALRHNRRSDYVKAGLALGFGLIGYQALRMLPVALVAGLVITLLMRKLDWRARLSYGLNLAVLAFISFVVFTPLFHFWTEFPDDYLRRTSTRMFGDGPTTLEDRMAFLRDEGGPRLLSNIRNTLLMFHYTYEQTWVSSAADEPSMDSTTAAFMLLGAAAWLAGMARSRDPVIWWIPVFLGTMLLATALALYFTIEVPSLTRAAGAIPPAYLIAALPPTIFCRHLYRCLPKSIRTVSAVAFAAGIILSANYLNTHLYFDKFMDNFARSAKPEAQGARIIRGFAESDGAYGNAFLVNWPHWWDYRAVSIQMDKMFWNNGEEIDRMPGMLKRGLERAGDFQLNPERDLLFFFSRTDDTALQKLSEWFPNGRVLEIEAVAPFHDFYTYRVPALGVEGMRGFLEEYG